MSKYEKDHYSVSSLTLIDNGTLAEYLMCHTDAWIDIFEGHKQFISNTQAPKPWILVQTKTCLALFTQTSFNRSESCLSLPRPDGK